MASSKEYLDFILEQLSREKSIAILFNMILKELSQKQYIFMGINFMISICQKS